MMREVTDPVGVELRGQLETVASQQEPFDESWAADRTVG
jgi:hypothetical protein